jgi:hypothetical protein
MTEPAERDHGLLGLVDRLLRKSEGSGSSKAASAASTAEDRFEPAMKSDAAPELLEPQLSAESAQTRTSSEMADIILRALKAIEGCPQQGLEVTVYGGRHWNAMLRITPAAGNLPKAGLWRARVREMAYVLRGQYDVVE